MDWRWDRWFPHVEICRMNVHLVKRFDWNSDWNNSLWSKELRIWKKIYLSKEENLEYWWRNCSKEFDRWLRRYFYHWRFSRKNCKEMFFKREKRDSMKMFIWILIMWKWSRFAKWIDERIELILLKKNLFSTNSIRLNERSVIFKYFNWTFFFPRIEILSAYRQHFQIRLNRSIDIDSITFILDLINVGIFIIFVWWKSMINSSME